MDKAIIIGGYVFLLSNIGLMILLIHRVKEVKEYLYHESVSINVETGRIKKERRLPFAKSNGKRKPRINDDAAAYRKENEK